MQNDDNSKRVMGYVHARELSSQEISQVSGGEDDDGDDGDGKKKNRTKVTVGTPSNGTGNSRSDR
ncbi:hypothetical protein FHR56_001805 [Xanthomonas sacchari]|uniref:hypothetical protein n=1 Tax=unclassified Xanthomonas TaxID=2643310 RepID=UPI001371F523|nr:MULTISPECIES: hypothetical protein [unclassified Xanthomonas]MBB6366692.1 hypothetical protein [Xanthomonas sp. F10]MXV34073.1 hypothetical protein [Xanthomonas sp. LMG 8989]